MIVQSQRATEALSRYPGHRGMAAQRTTDSRHDLPIASKRITRNFIAAASNCIWLAATSYIETA
jgi:putative transposase